MVANKLIVVGLMAVLFGCKGKQPVSGIVKGRAKEEQVVKKARHEMPAVATVDTAGVMNNIHHILERYEKDSLIQIGEYRVPLYPALLNFYRNYGFKPAWLDESDVKLALGVIEGSSLNGLRPEDYGLREIGLLVGLKKRADESENKRLAQLDILLTHSIYQYAAHLINGKLNPANMDPSWNYSKRRLPEKPDFLLRRSIEQKNLEELFVGFEPGFAQYGMMKKWLATALDEGKWEWTKTH